MNCNNPLARQFTPTNTTRTHTHAMVTHAPNCTEKADVVVTASKIWTGDEDNMWAEAVAMKVVCGRGREQRRGQLLQQV